MTRVAHLKEPGQQSVRQTAGRTGKYLYAVIAAAPDRIYGPFGLDGLPVYSISKGRVAAVLSDLPNGKIRPERRHLSAHQHVLRRLMEDTTPLPVAFGVIADGNREVQNLLSRNQEEFLRQLQEVAGKVEMGVRATWDVPNIFEYFVNTHPELKEARDRIAGSRGPAQEEKIELGRFFDRILNEERDAQAERVESILSPRCSEIKRNKCRQEREVMNLACLVGKRAQAEFETAVFEAAKLFDNNFAFDYSGPWAPHNFVEINLAL